MSIFKLLLEEKLKIGNWQWKISKNACKKIPPRYITLALPPRSLAGTPVLAILSSFENCTLNIS